MDNQSTDRTQNPESVRGTRQASSVDVEGAQTVLGETPLKVWRFTDLAIILSIASTFIFPVWVGLLWLFGPVLAIPIIVLLGLRIFMSVWRFIKYRKSKNPTIVPLRIVDALMMPICAVVIFALL